MRTGTSQGSAPVMCVFACVRHVQSTTPMDPRVLDKMMPFLNEGYAMSLFSVVVAYVLTNKIDSRFADMATLTHERTNMDGRPNLQWRRRESKSPI